LVFDDIHENDLAKYVYTIQKILQQEGLDLIVLSFVMLGAYVMRSDITD
jgi:hypothetical protein